MAGQPVRGYRIEEYTRTICPACWADGPRRSDEEVFCDGLLVSHHDRIWLRRFCPVHGESESLYEESAALWRARAGWSSATACVTPDRDNNLAGFPHGYRDGLPASHGQHTCILVLNLTQRCNLGCPACYATALAPGATVSGPERPTRAEILHTVDTVIAREQGKLGVAMLSGGEPTVREDLEEVVEELRQRPITRIMLNTNGRRIARDNAFLDQLHRWRDKVEVYLQCDGLEPATSLALRGEELAAEKLEVLRRLDAAGVFCTLVMTVALGVNDGEVGRVARLGLETPHCAGIAFQPVFGSGRAIPIDPLDRVTPTGVLQRLESQTSGLLRADDFIPLPCSHRDCCDLTYLVRTEPEGWQSLPKMVGRERLREWIGLLANDITFADLKEPVVGLLRDGTLRRVLSEQRRNGAPDLTRDLAQVCDCVPGLMNRLGKLWQQARQGLGLEQLAERTFRITVKMFMDQHTLHEARLRQCCVHTGTFEDDPRRYSFCWRWLMAEAGDFPAIPDATAALAP